MKKKNWIILFFVLALVVGIGLFFYFRNLAPTPSAEENNYEANRTSTDGVNTTSEEQQQSPNEEPSSPSTEVKQGITESAPPVEEQMATFTTKIYSNDSARQNNISITCNTLNGTIVKNGATFSFCNTVGQSTTSKGYQKADIFDKDGNKKKGLGGRKLSN